VTCAYFSVSAIRSWVRPERGQVRAEPVVDRLRRESDRQALELVAVAREADERRQAGRPASVESLERGIGERPRDLPGPIGAEVHEDDGVAVGDPRRRSARRNDGRRAHELVRLAACVGGGEPRFDRRGRERRPAVDEKIVGLVHAFPALVAIHRVVAADDGSDARTGMARAQFLEQRERRAGTARRRVAAVEESVHVYARRSSLGRQFDHRGDLALVAVHAARREEPEHVQRPACVARGADRARSAAFFANSPVSIAWSIRV
jgi:hypothetical protein